MKRPLDIRGDASKVGEYDGPHEGVPNWLFNSLSDWILGGLRTGIHSLDSGSMQLLELTLRRGALPRTDVDLLRRLREDPELALVITDALLTLETDEFGTDGRAELLDFQLAQAGSVWTVGLDADGKRELQRRVSAEAKQAFEEAAGVGDRAGDHLRMAWSRTYSRDRDANSAYDHAVKAVEVAAKPIVSPQNDKATLGTIIADLRNKPEKWTTVFDVEDDIKKLIAALELLWQGMYRHGDETKPLAHSQRQAEGAVHLAVMLVQWFRSGTVALA